MMPAGTQGAGVLAEGRSGRFWSAFRVTIRGSKLIFHSDYSDSDVVSTFSGQVPDCECGGIQSSPVLLNVFYIVCRESASLPCGAGIGFLFVRLCISLSRGCDWQLEKAFCER